MKAPVLAAAPARKSWAQRRRHRRLAVQPIIHPEWCGCPDCDSSPADVAGGVRAMLWGAGLGLVAAAALGLAQLQGAL